MKTLLLSFLLLVCYMAGWCQGAGKPAFDTNNIRRVDWSLYREAVISGDGKYAAYTIVRLLGTNSLVLQSTDGLWKREFAGKNVGRYLFCGGSKKLLIQVGDSLLLITPGSDEVRYITGISMFSIPENKSSGLIAYRLKKDGGELVLYNVLNEKEQRFFSVSGFSFNRSGTVLLLKTEAPSDSAIGSSMQWIDLSDGKSMVICSFGKNAQIAGTGDFDVEGRQVAFTVTRGGNNEIWYYRRGMLQAELRATNQSAGIKAGMSIGNFRSFSADGRWLFFELKRPVEELRRPVAGKTKVDVWSYRDLFVQPEQMRRAGLTLDKRPILGESYLSAMPAPGGRVVVVQQQQDERVLSWYPLVKGDYIVITDNSFAPYWWPQKSDTWLVSLKDGRRRLLKKGGVIFNPSFSPGGRYLVYWDKEQVAFFSYDLASGTRHNLSKTIPERLGNASDYAESVYIFPVSDVAGWYGNDSALLLYDNYDLWRLDPSGRRPSVNLTGGYGKKHHVKLRLVYEKDAKGNPLVYTGQEECLLTGFNEQTKYNGFLRQKLARAGDPVLLTMGPYTYYYGYSQIGGHYYDFGMGMQPQKAADTDGWLVERSSSVEAPNLYFTRDFSHYTALTALQPQKAYNWLTTELVSWQLPDGHMSQGVLYKPENFDPKKKYPLLFNYYEKLSHRMYEFPTPGLTNANINIPWFVSNGYLVFTPDIHYSVAAKTGITCGEHALNAVVSAAKYLSRRPYVDPKRMGIQGHSFGGLETAFIATHTGFFAAAAEVAGSTDPVSRYLTLTPFASSTEHFESYGMETSHESYGATLWEHPELYLKNSAVLSAHKATMPLLIGHNMRDNQVQWRQGVELYMAMRRLGKRCWLLQYDEQSHGMSGYDYTMRLVQFFDHYLKGALPPKWMTEGVPARLKGIESGFEMDTSGRQP